MRHAAPSVADWSSLVDLASRHRLAPMLRARLRDAGVTIPEEAAATLGQRARASAQQAMVQSMTWMTASAALCDAVVPHLPYKGPPLAVGLYGDVGLRPCLDVDIVVDPREVERAAEVLAVAGYGRAAERTPARDWLHQKSTAHLHHRRAPGWPNVELHWRLAPPRMGFDAFQEHALAAGLGLPGALPDEELLLALCIHGAKHQWEALGWLADVAALTARMTDESWVRTLDLAHRLEVERPLTLGVGLASELLGARVPAQVAERRERAWYPRARSQALATLLGQERTEWSALRLTTNLQPSVRERARVVLRRFMLPTIGDIEAVELPRGLRWLYYLMRPFRLAIRYGLGVRPRTTSNDPTPA